MNKRDLTEPACEILSYLIENPRAQDSFEGIVQWWILERSLKARLRVVTDAVEHVVEHGFLEQRTAADGTVLYRSNPKRAAVIQRLLREHNFSGEGLADEG